MREGGTGGHTDIGLLEGPGAVPGPYAKGHRMTQPPLDPQIAERLRAYIEGRGSPSAKKAILAWLSGAEAGLPGAGNAGTLAQFVRALARLTYSRGFFGFAEGEDGSHVDVRMQATDVTTALMIEADLVLFYDLDEDAREIIADARTEVAEKTFGTIERSFKRLFE